MRTVSALLILLSAPVVAQSQWVPPPLQDLVNTCSPWSPTDAQVLTYNNGGACWEPADAAGGSSVAVEEGDSQVIAEASSLDFGSGFDVADAGSGEADITLDVTESPLAALEESAEIDGDIATHAGDADAHHAATVDTDTTCLDAGVSCLFAGSASEGGPATTATALAANGTNCSAGNYPLGVDASGNAESCTAEAGGLTWNVTEATCTGDGNGGALTVNGSSEIVCSADDGGAGSSEWSDSGTVLTTADAGRDVEVDAGAQLTVGDPTDGTHGSIRILSEAPSADNAELQFRHSNATGYGVDMRIDNTSADFHIDRVSVGSTTADALVLDISSGRVGIGLDPSFSAGDLTVGQADASGNTSLVLDYATSSRAAGLIVGSGSPVYQFTHDLVFQQRAYSGFASSDGTERFRVDADSDGVFFGNLTNTRLYRDSASSLTIDDGAGGAAALSVTGTVTVGDILKLTPKATAPATCTAAVDLYSDTSGALCWCSSTNTWENLSGTGSCE